MSNVFLIALLKPFAAFFALLVLAIVVRYPMRRWFPAGKIKNFLLTDVSADENARRLREWRARRKRAKQVDVRTVGRGS